MVVPDHSKKQGRERPVSGSKKGGTNRIVGWLFKKNRIAGGRDNRPKEQEGEGRVGVGE